MTEESYIEDVIRPNLLQTKLAEAVAAQDTEGEGDDATLAQAQAMSEQFNGAKRSSHILLTAEEGEDDAALAARAQELLDQITPARSPSRMPPPSIPPTPAPLLTAAMWAGTR